MTSKTDYGQIEPTPPARTLDAAVVVRWGVAAIAIAAMVFLAAYNLGNYPLTWFDEGSHLHVPKTLFHFGVYADYSSDGFRYYGPTIGVGPTVLLPIAGVFSLLGVGLLQARLVMVVYLLATVAVFYFLSTTLGGRRTAWLAVLLLISSRGASFLLYGRQVLGEVPALFYLVAGLCVWFAAWTRGSWWRLVLAGILIGLAMITKYQYLLFIAPALVLAWLANLVYYRSLPQRVLIVPGMVAAAGFALWQLYLVANLGPATASENLDALRKASAGAAFSFSPALMKQSMAVLLSFPNYAGALLPALVYGFTLTLPRRTEGLRWGILWLLVVSNLLWFVVASVGWWRYAFLGLALGSVFVARFFADLIGGLHLKPSALWAELRSGGLAARQQALRLAAAAWLAVIVVLPLAETMWEVASPGFNAPQAMATYLNSSVPQDRLIETWEPELGFLTDHRYHFPPASLLADAVNQAFLGGPPVASRYRYVQDENPEYVLVGNFPRALDLYPAAFLASGYKSITTIGGYELFARRNP